MKFALNADFSQQHEQLQRYYDVIARNSKNIALELQMVFRQKLELGLYQQPANRLAAMKTLTFSSDIRQCQFIVMMVDYNPYSRHLGRVDLSDLPFANQVQIFHSGFAMWQTNLTDIDSIDSKTG